LQLKYLVRHLIKHLVGKLQWVACVHLQLQLHGCLLCSFGWPACARPCCAPPAAGRISVAPPAAQLPQACTTSTPYLPTAALAAPPDPERRAQPCFRPQRRALPPQAKPPAPTEQEPKASKIPAHNEQRHRETKGKQQETRN